MIPRYGRWLLWLIRGRGAEFVRGDIEERFRRDRERGVPAGRRHRRLVADLLVSLGAWYRPSAVRRRTPKKRRPVGRTGLGLGSDLRFVTRGLRRTPAFTATVVLTLGLGIGATTTIYGVVDAIVVRPLPYPDPDQLVALGNTFPGREWADDAAGLQRLAGVSWLNFEEWRARAATVDRMAGFELGSWLLPDQGRGPELVTVGIVTSDFFGLLRVTPVLGRTFHADDHLGRSGRVAVLSYTTWVDRFGGDPAVVGRTVPSLGNPYTVVGVLPRGFRPPEAAGVPPVAFWTPLDRAHPRYESRGRRSLFVYGRTVPGADLAAVRDEIDAIQAALADESPDGNVYPDGSRLGAGANALHAETVGSARQVLLMFLSASGVLLLVAALNAAHLLLVRGIERGAELQLRQALGASRGRLVRLLVLESVVLSALGGIVGVLLAYGGVELFRAVAPSSLPRLTEVVVNPRIIGIGAAVALTVGTVVGLIPALRLTGRDLSAALRRHAQAASPDPGVRWRGLLVSGQLALAVVLAVVAGLLLHSFVRVTAVDPGFEVRGLTAFSLGLKRPGAAEEAVWQAWDGLLAEVRRVPGLEGAAAASNLPFQSPNWAPWVLLPGEPDDRRRSGIAGYVVTPTYFTVLGAAVVRGRGVVPGDGPDAAPVAVVNRAFVRDYLDGRNPLGMSIRFREGDTIEHRRIVGVVNDLIQTRAEEGKRPAVYVPHRQSTWPIAQVVVRSGRPMATLAPELRQAAARFSPFVPVTGLSTMEDRVGSVRTEPRFRAILLVGFAGVTLLLAAIGLYGALAYAVGRRTRELGIRMALGADRVRIYRSVLQQAMTVTAVGLAVGLAAAAAVTRYLQGFLFGIDALDGFSFAAAAAVLVAVAVLATLGPAGRATGVDIARSLRSE